MAAVRLQQFEHSVVVCTWFAGQGKGDSVREVKVAHRHSVAISPGDAHDMTSGPCTDPADGRESRECVFTIHFHDLFEAPRSPGSLGEDVGPLTLDSEGMQILVREPGHRLCIWQQVEVGRSKSRLAKYLAEATARDSSLFVRDLLPDDRREQHLENATRLAQSQTWRTPVQVSNQATGWLEILW